MNTTPTDPAVAATVFQSLWDNNLFAVRVSRWVAWLRAQSGAVSYMTVAYCSWRRALAPKQTEVR